MNPEMRNSRVTQLMSGFFDGALEGRYKPLATLESELDLVFRTTTWGFREILLVIAVARLLDSNYHGSKGFYDCNPRSLYEGPIRAALLARGVPHRKSGPLNVAKAAKAINEEWAAQREPQGAARAVVKVVAALDRMGAKELENFAGVLHARFLEEAVSVRALVVEARPESDPGYLLRVCMTMISRTPDGGNTAQRAIGLMMAAYHEILGTGVEVIGHLDRASVTTTTSKKAGDISEGDHERRTIYEVTTKPFGAERMREAYEGACAFDEANDCVTAEIIVICRPDDAPAHLKETGALLYLGTATYQDLSFHFVDIDEWLAGQLLRMPALARLDFYRALSEYVNEASTAVAVKKLWRKLHDE